MSPPKPSSKDRKARPGGCVTIAAQRARIALKKGGGGIGGGKSPAGIVSELLFEHGLLTALLAMGQIMGALTQAAAGALVGLIAGIGRNSPAAFQAARDAKAAEPVVLATAPAVGGPRRSRPSPRLTAGGGSNGNGVAPTVSEPKPSPAYEKKSRAHKETIEESRQRFGDDRVYEYIAQSLEYNLEPPLDKYVKGIPMALEKVSPEVARLVSRHNNSPNGVQFRAAKSILKAWSAANPGYSSACGVRAIFNDLVELQRVWEDAHRPDPTKGPAMSGPENDGDEGSDGRRLKSPVEDNLPALTPFKR